MKGKTERTSRNMKTEIDLSKMKKRRNPYASRLKKQVTIRMGTDIVAYFKEMAEICRNH